MVNKNKVKGSQWERDAAELLNSNFPGTWKRIAMSGALGTILEIPTLQGDVTGHYTFFPQKFLAEAKVGYGGSQMQIQKEWFDKIREQAEHSYSLPVVLLKFEKARKGVRHVICMDFDTWDTIMDEMEKMSNEIARLQGIQDSTS